MVSLEVSRSSLSVGKKQKKNIHLKKIITPRKYKYVDKIMLIVYSGFIVAFFCSFVPLVMLQEILAHLIVTVFDGHDMHSETFFQPTFKF